MRDEETDPVEELNSYKAGAPRTSGAASASLADYDAARPQSRRLDALAGRPLPIYGGGNVHDRLYVEDHCRAVVASH